MSDEPVYLSAVDFLGLAEERVVARVDLAQIGRRGVLFVRELTADEKAAVLPRPKGKGRVYKDQSVEIPWDQLSTDAVAKFLKVCLVSLKSDPTLYFGQNGDGSETAVIPVDQIVPVFDEIVAQTGQRRLAMEKLGAIPNSVADLLMKKIRVISGLDDEENDDTAVEKKG